LDVSDEQLTCETHSKSADQKKVVSVFIFSFLFPSGNSGGFSGMILDLLKTSRKQNIPLVGFYRMQDSGHGTEKTGKAAGRIPSKTAWRPYVSAVFTQDRHFRFDTAQARIE
jgi:hypothetical protein